METKEHSDSPTTSGESQAAPHEIEEAATENTAEQSRVRDSGIVNLCDAHDTRSLRRVGS